MKVVLRLYGKQVWWASDPSVLHRGSTCISEGSWTGLQRVSISQMGGSGVKAVQALKLHSGLWNTLLDFHIAGSYALPVGGDTCRCSCLAPHQKKCHVTLGSSASHHAPTWERAKSSDWVTSFTWNCDREGLTSCDPQSIWVNSSHRLGSLEKCT